MFPEVLQNNVQGLTGFPLNLNNVNVCDGGNQGGGLAALSLRVASA